MKRIKNPIHCMSLMLFQIKFTKIIVMKSLAKQLKIETVLSRGHHCVYGEQYLNKQKL